MVEKKSSTTQPTSAAARARFLPTRPAVPHAKREREAHEAPDMLTEDPHVASSPDELPPEPPPHIVPKRADPDAGRYSVVPETPRPHHKHRR